MSLRETLARSIYDECGFKTICDRNDWPYTTTFDDIGDQNQSYMLEVADISIRHVRNHMVKVLTDSEALIA